MFMVVSIFKYYHFGIEFSSRNVDADLNISLEATFGVFCMSWVGKGTREGEGRCWKRGES